MAGHAAETALKDEDREVLDARRTAEEAQTLAPRCRIVLAASKAR
ncbi:MAG TPA: hypothetical protein VHS74_03045 [Solirubrobacterales bacterium]|nr:hypothetical protein [Solirubrobacterales bacterium]